MSAEPTPEPTYSDENFWEKLGSHAKQAGESLVFSALCLYLASQKEDCPVWAKTIIYGSIAYFISPLDVIPDITPVVGFSDDVGVVLAATAAVASQIDEPVRTGALAKMKSWWG